MKLTNNKKFILNIFSTAMIIYAAALLPSFIVSLYNKETLFSHAVISVIALCLIIGISAKARFTYRASTIKPRVHFFTTLLVWCTLILMTSIIYFFASPDLSIADSIFEATASWTTTGAEAVVHTELTAGMLLMRATCNWLGGIGIILIVVGILPEWNFTGHSLAITEIPGPTFLKTSDTFKRTYRLIIKIYIALTLLEMVLLIIAGMAPFTAVLTALSGISTSGIQHINHGIVADLSTPIKIIITTFSLLGSINFSFYILIVLKRFRHLRSQTELAFYTVRILVTTLFITAVLIHFDRASNVPADFGNTLMQVVSCISTSGYTVSHCEHWPLICNYAIMLQMFIGTCAMSTGGGIKVGRFAIACKSIKNSMYKYIHPHATKDLEYNHASLSIADVMNANLYIAMFMLLFMVGALFISIDTNDIFSAFDFSQAMITNTGKTFGELTAHSYNALNGFSPMSELVMSVLMLAGRLEIYPLAMIFFKSFWVRDRNV